MSDNDKKKTADISASQPDAGLAAETRPVPSQAEGDSETIEEDLARQPKPDSSAQ